MAHGFLKTLALRRARELRLNRVQRIRVSRHGGGDLLRCEQACFVRVVKIRGVVSDFVSEIDQLSFERRAQPRQVLIEFGNLAWREIARMFYDAFTHLESQIQTGE